MKCEPGHTTPRPCIRGRPLLQSTRSGTCNTPICRIDYRVRSHLDFYRQSGAVRAMASCAPKPDTDETQMVEKSVPTGRKRAQAITELALVFPIFMVILLGVVDLGRAFYQAMALHEAAQAGALVALDWQKVTDLCPIPCATIET